ncbi:type VI secretion system ATPase TssH [Bordetella genomosp. 9]|uniref:ClpV1 family T6SS ATPase n=1 Tax=Bordetella genomosp. 9 TaxID=1416803 RepID=A0A1W6YX01_9BORD|nr:type VI secretion system ATPase TssH [Bordetella genomosp. 9]ARP85568.1 ClpV1 family T6SS ATPase [Bordetella genomosp. 9]
MAEISRAALFGKLSSLAFRTLESATVFCKLRGHAAVQLEHWLHQILQGQDSDLHRIVRHYELDAGVLSRHLVEALDRLPHNPGGAVDLAPQVEEAAERGWVYASLMHNAERVRSGHLLLAMLKTPSLRRALLALSRQFAQIGVDSLASEFETLLAASPEAGGDGPPAAAIPGEASGAIAPALTGAQEALARYTVDLTAQARAGELDPIVGRDEEIGQVIDILLRRRQNNPILTGEAGVGKTAVVEGLAQRIACGDVPPALRAVTLRTLDLGLLQAGASMKGEFEQRLRQIVEEVRVARPPVILFVDEAHTLIGAGGAAGTGDAANLIKPALARGTLRTIAATTWSEYKRHIEKDPALTRRFQPVAVAEPDEDKAQRMLRGLVPAMEAHHGVQVQDEALRAAVCLSRRYIADRQLPDKAVSLLDTACARVAASQHAAPPALNRARAQVSSLEAELEMAQRESALGMSDAARAAELAVQLEAARAECQAVESRWRSEQALVQAIRQTRAALEADDQATDTPPEKTEPHGARRASRLAELGRLRDELEARQQGFPLVLPQVDRHAVAAVVQDWTGIPVGRMVTDNIEHLLNLDKVLAERVVGQAAALNRIARCLQTARAGLTRHARPLGVFLLAGPSGVGKTETAFALADALYGGQQNLIALNMSEYQEAHSVSKLKGAPPGYVGYGEGGVLTEAVRRRPYSVVLLDEIEKAHPDVHKVFYQVFDRGWMEDGEGRIIDFRNTLILLTSNAGDDCLARLCANPSALPSLDEAADVLREPLLQVFPPALLARMTVIPYYPLQRAALETIVRKQLARLQERLRDEHGIECDIDEDVVAAVIASCGECDSGARLVEAVLDRAVLAEIGVAMLRARVQGERIAHIRIVATDGNLGCVFS